MAVLMLAEQLRDSGASTSKAKTMHQSISARKSCCPHVQLKRPETEAPSQRRRERQQARRRRKHQPSRAQTSATERLPARFFRPSWEWGGKSAGYAMGYAGSRPYDPHYGDPVKYVRDRMKTAAVAS